MLRFWSRPLRLASIVISLLLGCVECTAQSATATTEAPSAPILPANTPVILHLKESLYKKDAKPLYKKDAKPDYSLEFEVGYDVLANGQVVIQNGTAVQGSIRQIDHAGKGPPRVLIDPGPVQTVSGVTVRLTSSSLSTNQSGGIADVVSFGAETGPVLPVLVIWSLFQKQEKVLLDADAWGGVWEVVRTAEPVALDPAKQKASQEQIAASRKVAQEELCGLLGSPDSSNWNSERMDSLARRSGLGDDPREAELLRRAGELDGAMEVYQKLLASGQQYPPCSDKYSKIVYFFDFPGLGTPGGFSWVGGFPEERQEQLLRFSRGGLHLALAGLYREKHDFVHAISEYRTAVQLNPEDEQNRIGLISTLRDSGDLDAAVAESKEAIRIWPDRPYFHYLLGSVLVKKNDADAAIVELRWALKKAKNHLSPANCELGRAYERKGDLKAAEGQYRTAYRAHVHDDDCRAAYERLKLQLK